MTYNMKVAIVTQTLGPNLGGIIQNWALQQVLTELGHQPVTIDYNKLPPISATARLRITARNIRTFIKRALGYYARYYRNSDLKPNKKNNRFIRDHIIATEPCTAYSLIDGCGAYIVGSDQVWRPRYNQGVLTDSFLKFTGDKNVRRIAYAASFGASDWEYTPLEETECRALVSRFDAVSVREQSGINLCNRYFGIDAVVMPDPTLLIAADKYKEICMPFRTDNPCIVTYLLDYNTSKRKLVRHIAGSSQIIDINPHRSSVGEWLGIISEAETVITDSFHGTVFSIIFHRPFVVTGNRHRGNSRMESLLGQLGLQERMATDAGAASDIIGQEIDWAAVDARLELLQRQGREFLKSALQ